jgi:hypothetical protein
MIITLGLFLTLAGPVAAASINYVITLNTSSLAGTSGYLDLQFNPGTIPGTPGAQAKTTLFSTDSVLHADDPMTGPIGNVTGALPGDLTFLNTTMFNDYFQKMTFGDSGIFNVSFSGDFLTASSGNHSAFSVSFYDESGLNPLFSSHPSGAVLIIDLPPGGGGDGTTPSNGGPVATIINPSVASLTVVPLPTSAVLFATGLSFFVIAFSRHKLKTT